MDFPPLNFSPYNSACRGLAARDRRAEGARKKFAAGFTIVEVIIAVATFALVAAAAYGIVYSILKGIHDAQEGATVAALADQYEEIAHNLPYAQVGTQSGNPHGVLPDQPNALEIEKGGRIFSVYYVVNYVDDPADGTALAGTDSAPNDYKQVKLYVVDTTTGFEKSFLSTIVPKGLESMESGGALSIQVINAVGQPVSGASIHITNTDVSPAIDITRTSDANGDWTEVGLPPSVSAYHIVVTKSGYSTDETLPSTVGNPNPTKPDATVADGQVTKVSFAIDLLSNLTFYTENQICAPISGVSMEVQGAKLIGTSPDVLKFDNTYTSDTNGEVALQNIEWDTYTPIITDPSYEIYGSSPIQQVNLMPDTSQTFSLILGPAEPTSLLIVVKDAATGDPIEGATVEVQKTNSIDETQTTGGSILNQDDWSGGPGQATSSVSSMYWSDDGNINNNGTPAGLRLHKIGSNYANSGTVESSSFDTGTSATSYTTIDWNPTSQDSDTTLKFQIATNNDGGTWNFVGPDGTAGTYYTVPGTSISSVNDGNRYLRYKAYLSTTKGSKTPVLTSVSFNYVSGCSTPGQAMFAGIPSYSDYTVTVSAAGYTTQTLNNVNVDGYQVLEVDLSS